MSTRCSWIQSTGKAYGQIPSEPKGGIPAPPKKKSGKKKGGIKMHTNIHANEGVPSDGKFTSAAFPVVPFVSFTNRLLPI